MTNWLSDLRNRSVTIRVTMLAIVVLVAFAMVAPVAVYIGGSTALAAATLAAAFCLIGAAMALMASSLLPGPTLALAALMTSMAARMGIPLTLGLAIHLHGGPLAKAGLLYYLLIFYPITLAVETVLSLPSAWRSHRDTPDTAKM